MAMYRPEISLRLIAPATLLLSLAGTAAADTSACTVIASLPTVLSTPGKYCLQKDFSTAAASGTLISIQADDVRLDCNGHRLSGLPAGPDTQAVAIGGDNINFATVRNCRIRGFHDGIVVRIVEPYLVDSVGNVIEDNRLDGLGGHGISIDGYGGVVRRNHVIDADGGAIYVWADDVVDNTVDSSIVVGVAGGGVIARNRLKGPGASIHVFARRYSLVEANVVAGHPSSILCDSQEAPAGQVLVRGNVVQGENSEFVDCVDAGNNHGTMTP
jgi:hypothetical protein